MNETSNNSPDLTGLKELLQSELGQVRAALTGDIDVLRADMTGRMNVLQTDVSYVKTGMDQFHATLGKHSAKLNEHTIQFVEIQPVIAEFPKIKKIVYSVQTTVGRYKWVLRGASALFLCTLPVAAKIAWDFLKP